jgi:branched-chain amino acid transport system ATP-binding protein
VLEIADLSVRYGSVVGLEGLGLRVEHGEIVVLVGANGAGKSSVVNAIGGLVRSTRGSIRFSGVNVGRLNAIQRIRLGLAMVIEGRGIFSDMTRARKYRAWSIRKT